MATALPAVAANTNPFYVARGLVYRGYHRLKRANYARDWLVRTRETPAGSFRWYEPINRRGSDRLLAELDAACGPDDVIFDVGANVGAVALALTSEAPGRRVVAVEPSPPTVERLRANVRLNGLEDRIEIRPCCLGDDPGERRFYRSSEPALSSFDRESARRWGASIVAEETVPIRRLDELVGDGNGGESERETGSDDDDDDDGGRLPPPDAIKLDVGGTAPDVLRGARATLETRRPILFVESEAGIERSVPDETRGVLRDLEYAIREREGYWRCEPR